MRANSRSVWTQPRPSSSRTVNTISLSRPPTLTRPRTSHHRSSPTCTRDSLRSTQLFRSRMATLRKTGKVLLAWSSRQISRLSVTTSRARTQNAFKRPSTRRPVTLFFSRSTRLGPSLSPSPPQKCRKPLAGVSWCRTAQARPRTRSLPISSSACALDRSRLARRAAASALSSSTSCSASRRSWAMLPSTLASASGMRTSCKMPLCSGWAALSRMKVDATRF
mmetsp:Transcript_2419/g.5883  ORF Transcript_2419/g.5883 Transcript_2419/m.5883 type:complete len:222 (+) Transcript_2419:769-1434(+)